MKHRLTFVTTQMVLLCLSWSAAAQDNPTDFSGQWILDKVKTSDLPTTLESYTLHITQDAQQITIDPKIEGEIRSMDRRPGGMPGGTSGRRGGGMTGGMPGGGRSGGGMPGGGMPGEGRSGGGMPGGGMGGPEGMPGMSLPKAMVMAMALGMGGQKATYTLDGKEMIVKEEGREGPAGEISRPAGTVMRKAQWKKGGKQLELQANRKINRQGQEQTTNSRDRWEISKEGHLIVRRSITTPMGTEEVKLIFAKQS